MSDSTPTWIIEAYIAAGQSDLERRIGALAAECGGRFDYRHDTLDNANPGVPKYVELTYEFDDIPAAQLAMARIVASENVHVEGPSLYG